MNKKIETRDVNLAKNLLKNQSKYFLDTSLLNENDLNILSKIYTQKESVDIYDEENKTFRVGEILETGTRDHIQLTIDILDVLYSKGAIKEHMYPIFKLALLLHDTGKISPNIYVGQEITRNTFEASENHAFRSERIAREVFNIADKRILFLIKYHHTREDVIEDEMRSIGLDVNDLRMMKIIDGLAAGIHRKHKDIDIHHEDGKILIGEYLKPGFEIEGSNKLSFISLDIVNRKSISDGI